MIAFFKKRYFIFFNLRDLGPQETYTFWSLYYARESEIKKREVELRFRRKSEIHTSTSRHNDRVKRNKISDIQRAFSLERLKEIAIEQGNEIKQRPNPVAFFEECMRKVFSRHWFC